MPGCPDILASATLVQKFHSYDTPSLKISSMNSQNQAGFIAGKIQALQTAILHSMSNCTLKFPSSIAKTVAVDNAGYVWIAVKKPLQSVNEFDRSFHLNLNYYRKGMPFFLNVFGVARLVIDPEEINHLSPAVRQAYKEDTLLLSVRILQADYYENHPATKQNPLKKWKQSIVSLFTGDSYYYHFNMAEEKNYA
jgi:hypothetical protein